MKKIITSFFALTVALFATVQLPAAITTVSNAVVGQPATNNIGIGNGSSFSVQDVQYSYMVANPATYSTVFTNCNITNRIYLKYAESSRTYYSSAWSISVPVTIQKWTATGTAITPNETTTLTINYDPSAGTTYTDQSAYTLVSPGYRVQVTVNAAPTITGSISTIPADVRLEAELITTRSYIFNQSAVSTINSSYNPSAHSLTLYWNYLQGAETYDVEWVHMSAYNQNSPAPDFTRATRITTSQQSYTIQLPYDDGQVFYRVRGVGYPCTQSGFRQEGQWSLVPNGYTVTNFDASRNWEYSAVYAEEGKRKEVMSYYDGTGKQRQVVTLLNTERVNLTGETMYDYEGRPAVQTLPAPTAARTNKLAYTPNFSLNALNSSEPYDRDVFDKDNLYYNAATCTLNTPTGMHTSQGASNYYSPQNSAVNTGMYQALPDAHQYPFTQTMYGRDGRPVRQGGPGPDHHVGSGHAIETYYTTPTQQKIDRFYGNEAGYAEHYNQVAVKDANGQLSVSYLDLSGRTIATALVGDAPASLDALNTNTGISLTEDFDNSNFAMTVNGATGRLINAFYLVSTPGTYTFTYTMTPEQYAVLCTGGNYICAYDLKLNIFDECDQPLTSSPNYLGSTQLIQNIVAPSTYSITFTVNFTRVGVYRIEKWLQLNQAALHTALNHFTSQLPGTCISTQSQLQSQLNAAIDASDCAGCAATCAQDALNLGLSGSAYTSYVNNCISTICADTNAIQNNACASMLGMLGADMRPGGQYFDNRTALTSLFAPASNYWLYTNLWPNGDARWTTAGFPHPAGGNITTWSDLRTYWQSGWENRVFTGGSITAVYGKSGTTLTALHPEYCHYGWCTTTQNSQNFDFALYGGNTLTWAQNTPNSTTPYLNTGLTPVGTSMLNQDPYFTTTPGNGDAAAMSAQLSNWNSSGVSMWTQAGTLAGCTGCDAQWQQLRVLYISKKQELIRARKIAAGCGYLCDASTPPDAVADACAGSATDSMYIRVPDLVGTLSTAPNTANWQSGMQSFTACVTQVSSVNVDVICAGGPTTPSTFVGSATITVNSVDITCGLLSTINNPAMTEAQLTLLLVNAINSCISAPHDFTAAVDPADATRFILYAPASAGNLFNNVSPVITFTDPAWSWGGTGKFGTAITSGSSWQSCWTTQHCFCNQLSLLTGYYNATNPTTGTYIVSRTTYPTLLSFVTWSLNTAYGTSVSSTDVQAWMNDCSSSGQPVTNVGTPALPVALDCANPVNPCYEDAYDITGFYASVFYQQLIEDAQNNFIAEYTAHCFGGNFKEHYEVIHTDKEYHYTLYYYDQAGSLVRTVPPAGVKLLNSTQIAQVNTYRTTGGPSPVYPAHTRSTNTMVTNYKYNSLNQLKESATPDGGTTTFWYDKVGRLLASQNARQAATGGVYSYTLYDNQNRPYQVGELATVTPMTQTIADDYNGQYLSWVNAAILRQQVTQTYYDNAFTATTGVPFAAGQQYLRQRVATVTIEESYDGNDATYNHATHYSYDVHGNVNELVQDNPELDHLGGQAYSQRYKRMTYVYELVSGNVKEVRYQSGEGDMYVHRYSYDADNRVLAAWTSRDGVLWSRDAKYQYYLHGPLGRTELGDKQVQGTDYVFTIQGWIKGVNSNVLDRDKDIGKDGHNTNATNYIASQQGIHSSFGTDAYGYTLDYFWNTATGRLDYKPINTNAQTLYNDAPNATSGVNDLYNGNIKGMAVALQKPNGTALPQNLGLVYNQYKYDQLNRITLHQAFTGTSTTAYASLSNTNEYRNVFSYDANGNIITQLRNGTAASGLSMDNLQYWYYTNTGGTYNPATATPTNATNKLAYVDDSGTPGNYADDLEDQAAGNYTYDATGQLTGDAAEQIANIEWTVYGKIANINRTAGSLKKELTFKYDALGQRVTKLAKSRDAFGVMTQENWTYTYYVRDAQGNVMATYKRTLTADIDQQLATDKLVLEENQIYGSARLGVDDRESENVNSTNTFAWNGGYDGNGELVPAAPATQAKMAAVNVLTPKRKLGLKLYELSNHLGNVLVTVSDRKLGKQLGATSAVEYYMADVRSTSDYSAFGAPLSGRTFSSPSYKYGFNGMEKDAEMHGNDGDSYDFGARMYDARVGRWLSRDEYSGKFPAITSYCFVLNNPILFIDPDGRIVELYDKSGNKVATISSAGTVIEKGMENSPILKAYNETRNYVNSATGQLYSEFESATGTLKIIEESNPIGGANFSPPNCSYIDANKNGKLDVEETNSLKKDDPNDLGTIKWDPLLGFTDAQNNASSPALVLTHELIHAKHYKDNAQQYFKDFLTPLKDYDNAEEKKTIEAINLVSAALHNGDGGYGSTSFKPSLRLDHSSRNFFPAVSATSNKAKPQSTSQIPTTGSTNYSWTPSMPSGAPQATSATMTHAGAVVTESNNKQQNKKE